ncbi:1-phosphatidylinositol phosphodiesterase-like [Asterias amurensis]|uniref:1-phosphatidylinositol phosphodiesterase-like n=1 Tax=Asterias amurensis TaxID=7602 RepID=UPI003AB3A913
MGACCCRISYKDVGYGPVDTSRWMSTISDDRQTSDLSLPGTHESMSLYGGCWAQCQSWSLATQYNAGVRFVDIRCRHFNNSLPIHHGVIYQHANFDDVLKTTISFLDAHPTEIIFMRIREEYLPKNNTTTFAEAVQTCVNKYPPDRLWCGDGIPRVGEARGMLVVLRNYYGSATFGLPYGDLDIEDRWVIPSLLPRDITTKWNSVRSHLEKAQQGSRSTLYLTYSSGASALACPCAVSRQLNSLLAKFFHGQARWGLVAMDFVKINVIFEIIKSNFQADS